MQKKLAKIYHFDSFGKRDEKYAQLDSGSITNTPWKELTLDEPYYFFVPKDFGASKKYEEGFKVDDLFLTQSMGILTSRDDFVIDFSKDKLRIRIQDFTDKSLSDSDFTNRYQLGENYQWKVSEQRNIIGPFDEEFFQIISYRPFDNRNIYYQDNIVFRSRREVMKNLQFNNIAINLVKNGRNLDNHNYFISKHITDKGVLSSLDNSNCFPLYLYSDSENLDGQTRTPNLDATIWGEINKIVGETSPEDILDYIYAVLHSPSYRETYKEFLKIDFPRVPYPTDKANFLALVKLGTELRELHLLESPKVQNCITTYPVVGTNEVTKVSYIDGKVYINEAQYFGDVPQVAWEFYIGGYQPAQKWLKDRKGRTLTWEDIEHYQQVIVALSETKRIMEEIERVFKV